MPPTSSSASANVCPYCGAEVGAAPACPECKGLQEPLSRQASQNAMGPWYVRDAGMPFRPGCNLATLRMLVQRGRVTGESVVRGPTTGQFWRRASGVPGISHLLGVCYSCRGYAAARDESCPACGASFAAPEDRQSLGLGSVRLLPGQADASQIAIAAMEGATGSPSAVPIASEPEILPVAPPEDQKPATPARRGLSSEQRAAKLAAIEAEARELLIERRARSQARMTVIGIGVAVLLVVVIVVFIIVVPGMFTPAPAAGGAAGAPAAAPGTGVAGAANAAPGATTPTSAPAP